MAFVNRDSFAREELHRESVITEATCRECGFPGRKLKTGEHRLFSYRVEHDGGRKDTVPGLFCCLSCMRLYHGN